jgi:hypothetical protein
MCGELTAPIAIAAARCTGERARLDWRAGGLAPSRRRERFGAAPRGRRARFAR